MKIQTLNIPMSFIGPLKINTQSFTEEITVPLATYETTLWPSTNRGAKISRLTEGINVNIIQECMTRSLLVEANSSLEAQKFCNQLQNNIIVLQQIISKYSSFTKLKKIHTKIVAKLIYLRFEFYTGEAAGHNMTTLATQHIMEYILKNYINIKYISLSANFCVDKKNSAVNSILGRGKSLIAEMNIPQDICERILRTSMDQIHELNIKKNLLGSIVAGSIASANAHVANILLAIYLSCGQDSANIVEGSQAITYTEIQINSLYFSVTLPNIIVGTVGNGKNSLDAQNNLLHLGCVKENIGQNSRRLACIIAATVLCGELSLLAALTNYKELMRGHLLFERRKQ